jgi:hypothetical protein
MISPLAKGLEFRTVAATACDDVIPLQERIEPTCDEANLEEAYASERHLLCVAVREPMIIHFVSAVEPASESL